MSIQGKTNYVTQQQLKTIRGGRGVGHIHSNKDTLDQITPEFFANMSETVSLAHSHNNRVAIDRFSYDPETNTIYVGDEDDPVNFAAFGDVAAGGLPGGPTPTGAQYLYQLTDVPDYRNDSTKVGKVLKVGSNNTIVWGDGASSFGQLSGSPYDNTGLATALNGKADSSAIADMATKTWVNGRGFLTEITSSMVITALGNTAVAKATDADTLDGQHASHFASASDLETVLALLNKIDSWIGYDEDNNAIYIKKGADNNARNFYTFGDVAVGGPGSGGGGGASYLYQLTDVPDYRSGQYYGKYLRVKANGSGTEWVDVTSGVSSVINLTGDITQAQLRTALGLGSAAYTDSSAYATAMQGSHGETAYGYFSNGKLPAGLVSGLATVATSGAYGDLSGRPTIPTSAEDINAQNSIAFYDSGATSANDVRHSLAMLNKDTPSGNYYFVNTYFYGGMSATLGRSQLAVGYGATRLAFRRYSGGVWYDWNEIYHSGNCNNTSTPWSASSLTLNGAISGATSITASGVLSADTIRITNTNVVAHLTFSRGGANYIIIPQAGSLYFGSDSASAYGYLNISSSAIRPHNGTYTPTLGTSDYRWSAIYGVSENLSGSLTVGGSTTISGDISASTATFSSSGINALILNRANTSNGVAIVFRNNTEQLGRFICYATSAVSPEFRWENRAGTVVATLDQSGSFVASGEVTAGSDARWKHNITPVVNGIDAIMKLQPCSWEWNSDNHTGSGLIAQQVQAVFPHLVKTDVEGYLHLTYDGLHAYEISAIQHHENEIERLRKKVAELKQEVKRLRS